MALLPLNLYCLPNDVFDFLGTEATQLRLDDHKLGTGQTVVATGTGAAAGATTLQVAPLLYPLLAGSVLEFDGGAMPAVAEVQLAALAQTGSTTLTVSPLSAAVNASAQARDSGVNLATAQRLVKGCQYATSQVKLWCCSRYDDNALSTAWSVNRWATTLAARWVCRRQGNAVPASVLDECEEAMEELRLVKRGALQIEDIGTRNPSWPSFSNTRVDVRYDVARVRVESAISEPSPTQYGVWVDWNSILGAMGDAFF